MGPVVTSLWLLIGAALVSPSTAWHWYYTTTEDNPTTEFSTGWTAPEDTRSLQTETTERIANAVSVRLLGGTATSGRVEVYYNGRWGSVCDDYWTTCKGNARVICGMLGFPSNTNAYSTSGTQFGYTTSPFWLDDVKCTGFETDISQCPSLPWGQHNCGSYEVAGVVCNMTVASPNIISIPPSDKGAPIGSTQPSLFDCTVYNLVQEHLEWRFFQNISDFKGTVIFMTNIGVSNPAKYEVDSHFSLTLKNVQKDDAGFYRCGLHVAQVYHTAQLSVLGYPVCRPPSDTSYHEGSTIDLNCFVEYAGSTPEVTWTMADGLHNRTIAPGFINYHIQQTAELSMTHVYLYCYARIKKGTSTVYSRSCSTVLHVYTPPSNVSVFYNDSTEISDVTYVREGDSFFCYADGYPAPSFSWIKLHAGANVHWKCNFDRSQCASVMEYWGNPTNFKWIRKTGGTSSSATGPDYAYGGSGYYMYIETSNYMKAGNVAIMQTRDTYPAGDYCLTFAYHMYGATMGSLVVKWSNTPVWQMSGDKGKSWSTTSFTINANSSGKLSIEGISGTSHTGDAAVDEIELRGGSCALHSNMPVHRQMYWKCTFDQNSCTDVMSSWGEPSNFYWRRNSGTTPISYTGPNAAYGGNCCYMTILAYLYGSTGATAVMQTMDTYPPGTYCLKFAYHMYGATMGSIRVKWNDTIQWQKSGNQGNYWHAAAVTIEAKIPGQISIEGVRGTGSTGDAAVDEIELSSGHCDHILKVTDDMGHGLHEYTCSAWNVIDDKIYSKNTTVAFYITNAPMYVEVPPKDIIAKANTSVTLTCSVNNDAGKGWIEWWFQGNQQIFSSNGAQNVAHGYEVNGAYNLVIKQATEADSGMYECRLFPNETRYSAEVVIVTGAECDRSQVTNIPSTKNLEDDDTTEIVQLEGSSGNWNSNSWVPRTGQYVQVTCAVSFHGNLAPKVIWHSQVTGNMQSHHTKQGQILRADAYFVASARYHNKLFSCMLEPDEGDMREIEVACSGKMTVNFLQNLRITPDSSISNGGVLRIDVGKEILCEANGYPKPRLAWQKVAGSGPRKIDGGVLKTTEIMQRSLNIYECRAWTDDGDIEMEKRKLSHFYVI